MIALWLGLSPAVQASGLVFSPSDYGALTSMDSQVEVTGRVVSARSLYRFEDLEAGSWTFAAVIPEGAAIAGLRYRLEGQDWVEAGGTSSTEVTIPDGPEGDVRELIEGQVFATPLPSHLGGTLELELDWQQVLVAQGGAVTLTVPLDDGGLNPSDPAVSVALAVEGLRAIEEATLEPDAEVVVAGSTAATAWSGTVSDADALVLRWVEDPGAFGVELLAYRPQEDPFTGETGGAGYGLLVLLPGEVDDSVRVDQLFTFVLDVSDSMVGEPLETAVAAGSTWLRDLEPEDRLNVVPFASQAWPFRAQAPKASDSAIERAISFLERQEASGLSDPEEALTTALDLADDTLQQRSFLGCGGTQRGEADDAPPVHDAPIEDPDGGIRAAAYVVLLTDGGATSGITDPDEIAGSVADENTFGASLYALGIGEEADHQLLDRLARDSRGEARAVESLDEVESEVAALQERLRDPLLVQPEVVVEGGWDQAPAVLEDLAGGHELLLAFRFEATGEAEVQLMGLRGPEDVIEVHAVDLPETEEDSAVIARAWAQLRVPDLDAAYLAGQWELYDDIEELVRTYGVASEVVVLAFDAGGTTGDAATAVYESGDGAGCGCSAAPVRLGVTGVLAMLVALVRRRRPLLR